MFKPLVSNTNIAGVGGDYGGAGNYGVGGGGDGTAAEWTLAVASESLLVSRGWELSLLKLPLFPPV